MASESRYDAILAAIFEAHYTRGGEEFQFSRDELISAAKKLRIKLPKNIGDLLYSFRFRKEMPDPIRSTAPSGKEWTIQLSGRGKYQFRLASSSTNRILPRLDLATVKIPDATPEIIAKYALSDEQALLAKVRYNFPGDLAFATEDEQALLAKVRYNRLIDIFLGITTYSLQNHLRTTVHDMGQIEIDEVYMGINRHGMQFVIPVQAKGGRDQLGAVQVKQDIRFCSEKFPNLICRSVAAQFLRDDVIALFELVLQNDEVRVLEERHYCLVPADQISNSDLDSYRMMDGNPGSSA